MSGSRRPTMSMVGIALILMTVVLVASTAAGGVEVGAASPSTHAKQLAGTVANARTDAQRYRAVLGVMKELHVPVFSASGKQLAPGAKGLPRGFNLYDFQLRTVARSFSRTTSIDTFARLLSSGGKRVTTGGLRAILQAGVRAAVARSSSPTSTVALLVRELGLRHRPASDLTRDVPLDQPALDPLQALLIIADSAVRSGSGRYRLTTRGNRVNAGPCEETSTPLTRLLGVSGIPIGPTLPIWKLISLKQQLTLATKVTGLKGVHETHYGPPGHASFAGQRLKLGVHAEITEDFPDDIKCGYFGSLGVALPPKGPLKGVPVEWFVTGTFEKHFDRGNLPKRTDANGNAVAEIGVKSERVPGFGRLLRRDGNVIASVAPAANVTPVEFSQPWAVEYHLPRGFKFSGSYNMTHTAPDGTVTPFNYVFAATVCGNDPYASPWKLEITQAGGGAVVPVIVGFTLREDATTSFTLSSGATVSIRILPQQRQVRLSFTALTAAGGTWSPNVYNADVAFTDDTSCPEN